MKKAVSVLILVAILISAGAPTFAQNGSATAKGKISEPASRTTFGSGTAATNGRGVLVRWRMAVEAETLGYYVYRIDANGETLVSDQLIAASGMRAMPQPSFNEEYSLLDNEGSLGSIYVVRIFNKDGSVSSSSQFGVSYDRSKAFEVQFAAAVDSDGPNSAARGLDRVRADTQQLPAEVRKVVEANLTAPDPVAHKWVVAQPGVKIGVKMEGIYRITRAQLAGAGFNVNSNETNWQLYVEGVQQAITVGSGGSYVEFYGTGIDTIESDTRPYFLINTSTAGKRIATKPASPNPDTVYSATYNYESLRKERTVYVNDIMNDEAENYWGRILVSTPGAPYTFNVTGLDLTQPNVTLEIAFQGYSLGDHSVEISLNGQSLEAATGTLRTPFSKQYTVPTSLLVEGVNSLQMRANGPAGDISLFDSVKISYPRRYVAEQNRLHFYTRSIRATKLDGFTSSSVRLYDLSYQGSPIMITGSDIRANGPSFSLYMPAGRAGIFYAADESAVMQPSSITLNDPALIGQPDAGDDLLIISYKTFMAEAETWANYRRSQGFTARVVNIEEIYDEFNYGVLSAESIKSFLQYTNSNWTHPPKYVLLMGDATYDPRNYQGIGNYNFVPTKIVTTIYSETGSDEYLADFDNDGLAEMAVGRIAARTTDMVNTAYNKTVTFETGLGGSPLQKGFIFAYDDPVGYDFEAMSGRLRDRLGAEVPATMIAKWGATAQTDLIAAINQGKYMVNYSGHGTTGLWSSTTFFSNNNVASLTNASQPTIFNMLTCLNGYFLGLSDNAASLGERLLNSPTGGSVVSWASTGKTTPDIQEIMGLRFYSQVQANQIERMGDMVKDAKTVIGGGTDVRLSWVLLGDPMLKINTGTGGQEDINSIRQNSFDRSEQSMRTGKVF